MNSKFLVVIAGPTAVGKTALAVELAQHFKTAIISADSRQFYKEIAIGTAKPTPEEMQGVKHYFIDSHSIHDEINVNDYEHQVLQLLNQLFKDTDVVILTGGSGLYIDAVCDGFDDDLPEGNKQLRKELEALKDKYGIVLLQEKLKQLDEDFYNEIDLANTKRLFRAIEVCMLSKQKYSSLRKGKKNPRAFNTIKIALNRPKEVLNERINQRVDIMMQEGLLEEAKKVHPYKDKVALKTVGYRELFAYFEEETTLAAAIEKIKTNTRRYAKRQIAWFKRNDNDYHWFQPEQQAEIIQMIEERVG